MDNEILRSEVLVVLMDKEGVPYGEFAGLFHQVHGYQLKLGNYGYKYLKDLLENMKDVVELQNIDGQQIIKCRPSCQSNVISPCKDISSQKNYLYLSETCGASSDKSWLQSGNISLDEFPTEQPTFNLNAPIIGHEKSSPPTKQSTLQSGNYLVSEACSTKDTILTSKQMPSKKVVKIISQKLRCHHTGLRAARLRQYILEQHKIDLEIYSKELGHTDMLSMLKRIPIIKFLNTSGKNIIITSYFYKKLSEDPHKPSVKAEVPNAGPFSVSRSSASAKYSAQPDVFLKMKRQQKRPATDHLPIRTVNHTPPAQPKKDPLLWMKVVGVLRLFPCGIRVEKLKKHILNTHDIDLSILCQEFGYSDMSSMLKQIPGITALKGDAFIASDIYNPKAQPVQVEKVKFSEKLILDYLKTFPSGLEVEKLKQYIKNKYQINLMNYSQEKGFTDLVGMLQKIPGITVVNKNLVIASDVSIKSKSISNAPYTTTPAKCPRNAGIVVRKNLHMAKKAPPRSSKRVKKRSTSQRTVCTPRIILSHAMINRPQNVQRGLRPDVTYALALANNLKKDHINVHALHNHPSFNVQKAPTIKAAHPNYKEEPKDVLPRSETKDNLQKLLESHTNGLSISQLKKLYLFTFKQPLLQQGMCLRKFLMNKKDVAKINGLGVQMKVFPILSEDNQSTSSNIYSDPVPQEAAALVANNGENSEVLTSLQVSSPLSVKNQAEHLKQSLLSKCQPSSGCNQELTGEYIPNSSSEVISYNRPLYHNHFAPGSQFTKMNESPHPDVIAGNIISDQWPSLPQTHKILREIKQGAKVHDQLYESTPNKEFCDKQNASATFQPQGKDKSADISLQADQEPNQMNSKINYRQKEPQTSDLVHPIVQSGFSFVIEESGFSFLMRDTKVERDPKCKEISWTCSNTFTDSACVVSELSEVDIRRNTNATPLQANQSADCNMAAKIKVSTTEAGGKSVNVLPPQKADFSSKKVLQQTNNHPVVSGTMGSICSMPNGKTNDSQSQQHLTGFHNINVKSLLSEPKSQQATSELSQTGFTSLQEEGKQTSCAVRKIISVPSKVRKEAPDSNSICDFGQRGSVNAPSKQEVAKSNSNGLSIPPKSQSTKDAPNSVAKTQVTTQHIPTEKSLSGSPISHARQVSSPVSQTDPSVNTEGSSILHKEIDLCNVHRQINLKTLRKEQISQTENVVDGAKPPTSSAQKKVNTGHIYTHELLVTKPVQMQEEPHLHTNSHQYYNGITDQASRKDKCFTSESYHVSDSFHTPTPSEVSITPYDHQESADYSSEENTKTWQTDRGYACCIL